MNYKFKDFKHGQSCTCIIGGTKITDAKISIEEDGIFICQNQKDGNSAEDYLGYRYSWEIIGCESGFEEGDDGITNLVLIPLIDLRRKIL
jgi:hypothetical protein